MHNYNTMIVLTTKYNKNISYLVPFQYIYIFIFNFMSYLKKQQNKMFLYKYFNILFLYYTTASAIAQKQKQDGMDFHSNRPKVGTLSIGMYEKLSL